MSLRRQGDQGHRLNARQGFPRPRGNQCACQLTHSKLPGRSLRGRPQAGAACQCGTIGTTCSDPLSFSMLKARSVGRASSMAANIEQRIDFLEQRLVALKVQRQRADSHARTTAHVRRGAMSCGAQSWLAPWLRPPWGPGTVRTEPHGHRDTDQRRRPVWQR